MKNLPRVGIGVIVCNDLGEILLSKRQNSHGHNSFAPPGGHLEFFETIEDCSIREVEEEVGIRIESPEFIAITNDFFKEEEKHYISIFMKAKYQGCKVQNMEPHLSKEWCWYNINQLPKNLFLPLKSLIEGKCHGKGIERRIYESIA